MSASEEPASIADIRRYARGALAAAGALDTIPVPLDDVIAAVGIHREDLFDLGDRALPPRILAIARRLTGRVLGAMALEEKTLYVSNSMAAPRRRFTIGHEVGHSALPWHKDAYYVDDRTRLAAETRELLEQEANAFAAELMFGVDRFADEADSFVPSLGVPLALGHRYQTSAHAALRHYAMTSRRPVALLVLGRFPSFNGANLVVMPDQCATSTSFAERYGTVADLFGPRLPLKDNPAAATLASMTTALHEGPMQLTVDTAIGATTFNAGLFYNHHLRFMLLYRHVRIGRRIRAIETA